MGTSVDKLWINTYKRSLRTKKSYKNANEVAVLLTLG